MNKARILKEMGISSWKLREDVPLHSNLYEHSQQPLKVSQQMSTDFPVWTIVVNNHPKTAALLQNIKKVIQNFGVQIQLIHEPVSQISPQSIQGNLVLALGESAGQYFSQESAPVEELREILFETTNHLNLEVPVIVSYSLEELLNKPIHKKELWADLVFARNVFLDTMA
jgi:DNA polymerase III psi subunit